MSPSISYDQLSITNYRLLIIDYVLPPYIDQKLVDQSAKYPNFRFDHFRTVSTHEKSKLKLSIKFCKATDIFVTIIQQNQIVLKIGFFIQV